ncbi:hypothetical protein [Lachnoclostridium edouardi]|uniref:hypothetical protein n=1 Tax=Lachnoclostridium edouardi TaxID=1926283 RepID=UPI000C7B62F5|nr:hypothetical protein [Lachnoclostridium edouardi]
MKKYDYAERYLNVLKKVKSPLWDISLKMNQENPTFSPIENVMAQVGGPVIYLYILWVLKEAEKKHIKRLYFLARDGQIFYEVAKIICEHRNIDIDCRYLYCSRLAWRVPQYFLMKESCLDYICQRSMNLSIQKIFDRTLLDDRQVNDLCIKLGIDKSNMHRVLNHDELAPLRNRLYNSAEFLEAVYSKSEEMFDSTIKYMEQEGLLDEIKFALVDTGWVGSMEKSLGELLSYKKKKPKSIVGFYFGMFQEPKDTCHEYQSFLFSANKGLWRKTVFNNNLLECMCGASHGMTVGYKEIDGKWEPVFSSEKNLNSVNWNVNRNHRIICKYAEYACAQDKNINISYSDSIKLVSKLAEIFMMRPTKEEADQYGRYLFSDDMTENGVIELAPKLSKGDIFGEDFIPKVWKRIFVKDTIKRQTKSYWIEGSIVRSNIGLKSWHRFNNFLWHLLQYGIYN